jgi:tripartite-type tricarboxylate transporter receptor subunit TctC
MAEQGVDMNFKKVYFFLAPAGTDPEIINVFASALEKVTENLEFQAEVTALYYQSEYYSPEMTAEYLSNTATYFNKYKDLVSNSQY